MDGSLTRTCGNGASRCTACCKTHPLDLDDGFIKKPSVWCASCQKGGGCVIYNRPNRPAVCRQFQCEWLKGIGNEEHRPDKAKIVLELQSETPIGMRVLLIWEVAEGVLSQNQARNVRDAVLKKNVPVLYIYCGGARTLWLPKWMVDMGAVDCAPIHALGIRVECIPGTPNTFGYITPLISQLAER